MILHAEQRQSLMTQAFYSAIINIDMSNLQWQILQGFLIYSIAMILGRNMYSAIQQILNRLIGAAMAEFQLVGIGTQSQGNQLVPQADTKHWLLANQFLLEALLQIF